MVTLAISKPGGEVDWDVKELFRRGSDQRVRCAPDGPEAGDMQWLARGKGASLDKDLAGIAALRCPSPIRCVKLAYFAPANNRYGQETRSDSRDSAQHPARIRSRPRRAALPGSGYGATADPGCAGAAAVECVEPLPSVTGRLLPSGTWPP